MLNTSQCRIKTVKFTDFLLENVVTIIFLSFTVFGLMVSKGVSIDYFLQELTSRFFRNAFLVLSLIIPVLAGLGLNFGIVIGAMAGQIAIAFVRYFNIGGTVGLLLCFSLTLPIAMIFGLFTGKLYNKTRGQEMIASLIVGYFANGIYQFLFLFVIGVIIKVPNTNPLIKPDGIGIRSTVDLGKLSDGGIKYALDSIYRVPLIYALLLLAFIFMAYTIYKFVVNKENRINLSKFKILSNLIFYLIIIFMCLLTIVKKSSILNVKIPVVTSLIIISLCIFTELIMKTKLGQDFRSVGQSQQISEASGIDVDKTRIIAVIISTVLASWGQIIFLQNMGTLNTYGAHTQIGMFSVASLLVGGASVSKANIKQAMIGTILFNSMFIISPEIGKALFGQAILGEYFRTFMVYGVIGVALGLYVWKTSKIKIL